MRIAVLGLGFMGSTHLKALRQVSGAELAAVYSSDEHKLAGDLTGIQGNIGGPGEKLDFSGIRPYRDIDALLADPSIDAVDLCLPTDLHEPVALAALSRGKHVLVEKPMALDGAGADRMVEAARQAGRVLMTAHVLRFFPEFTALRQAISGSSGAIQLGRVRFAMFRRRCGAPSWGGWLLDAARSGGGAFDLLIHDADMCLHLFGAPQAITASGATDPAAGIDCLSAQLFYADGGIAEIAGGWYAGDGYPFSMEYSVALEGGSIEYRSGDLAPTRYSRSSPGVPLPLATTDGYAAEIAHFVECCRDRATPRQCPPEESALAVKFLRLLLEARQRPGVRMPCNL